MNRKALNRLLRSRRKDADWTDVHETLAALACTLADTLDDGAGPAVAAVSRELRAVVEQLSTSGESDAFDRLAAELSAALEH